MSHLNSTKRPKKRVMVVVVIFRESLSKQTRTVWFDKDPEMESKYHHIICVLVIYITLILSLQDSIIIKSIFLIVDFIAKKKSNILGRENWLHHSILQAEQFLSQIPFKKLFFRQFINHIVL